MIHVEEAFERAGYRLVTNENVSADWHTMWTFHNPFWNREPSVDLPAMMLKLKPHQMVIHTFKDPERVVLRSIIFRERVILQTKSIWHDILAALISSRKAFCCQSNTKPFRNIAKTILRWFGFEKAASIVELKSSIQKTQRYRIRRKRKAWFNDLSYLTSSTSAKFTLFKRHELVIKSVV